MSKTDTDKEVLALRYPVDVDVTDDIVKKRLENTLIQPGRKNSV